MKLLSIVTPCYNEQENVRELYECVKEVMSSLPAYRYEHIFIDNASKDRTVNILRQIAANDDNVKIIVNARNFGHLRSPYHALLQARGDAVISLVADFQDPPGLIAEFVSKWEAGYKIAIGVKKASEEAKVMFGLRSLYYSLLRRLSDVELLEHFTGFGLYDKCVVDVLRSLNDPNPYLRGLIADIGFESAKTEYVQPGRRRGLSKNDFFSLFDTAMLGMVSYTKVPLRLATMSGFLVAILSLFVAIGYFVYKLLFWNSFSLGLAPLVIGIFFFSAVQLFFLGIVGEYLGSIYTQVLKRPLVVEKERVNFPAASDLTPNSGAGGG